MISGGYAQPGGRLYGFAAGTGDETSITVLNCFAAARLSISRGSGTKAPDVMPIERGVLSAWRNRPDSTSVGLYDGRLHLASTSSLRRFKLSAPFAGSFQDSGTDVRNPAEMLVAGRTAAIHDQGQCARRGFVAGGAHTQNVDATGEHRFGRWFLEGVIHALLSLRAASAADIVEDGCAVVDSATVVVEAVVRAAGRHDRRRIGAARH